MPRSHAHPTRRAILGGVTLAAFALASGTESANALPAYPARRWPTEIPLPNGFSPEGITIDSRPYAYFASRANGAVYGADLRTGEGTIVYAGEAGTSANGLKIDHDGLLYLTSGSVGGVARVVDSRTGRLVTTYQLCDPTGHFINDVTLVGDRAWFTDSYDAVLYGVPRGGTGEVRALPITGDWVQGAAGSFSANGLVTTPDGTALIAVNGGQLYRVPLATGNATRITLMGTDAVDAGDGLVRDGHRLFVVQNRLNQVSVLDLDAKVSTATLHHTISDPRFDVPTTAALHLNRLYVVNGRLTSPQLPDTTFNSVSVTV
ncbi:superoxide dismutase [Streptomyces canus]|uniref:SMP-30/gluconolactonase/LRE family protein n=1 Tax=Streptomyces canus TaxID=58343 RepID=UPI0033E9FA75